ncbi:MAG TPA: aromatic ring-hydroxylating dioxygenase subunit alpha [Mycobacteriales bacterium]|nr:aromatic ring-hydroxylating dioxygenase subunit alpha [Mycobacteriales bacterium]
MGTRISQYWHPLVEVDALLDGPVRVTLLGQDLAVFLDENGEPSVLQDLCVHRGAPLSMGTTHEGRITCPYHGWTYDGGGMCVRIPALPAGKTIPRAAKVPSYHAAVRYGLVWGALEDPVFSLPEPPRGVDTDPAFSGRLWTRLDWQTSAGRAVENEMDLAHFPFVHPYLLADPDVPEPLAFEVQESEYGLWFETKRFQYRELGEAEVTGYARYHHTYPFTHHLEIVEPGLDGEAERVSVISAFHQPTGPKQTIMWWWLHQNFPLPPDGGHEIDIFLKILEQDRLVAEAVKPEAIPSSIREELHLKVADAPSIMFRRWLESVDMMGLAAL